MCFSASASFIAGTTLTAVGVAALRNTKTKNELPFAMIPLLFGIQQLTEGVIWLTFHYDVPLVRLTMTYIYSGFSHVVWPMYVPFAMGVLETVRWRKSAIFAFLAAGISVGLYLLYSIVSRPLIATDSSDCLACWRCCRLLQRTLFTSTPWFRSGAFSRRY